MNSNTLEIARDGDVVLWSIEGKRFISSDNVIVPIDRLRRVTTVDGISSLLFDDIEVVTLADGQIMKVLGFYDVAKKSSKLPNSVEPTNPWPRG